MGPKRDRREYFKNYYKNISDDKKEELRGKRREAYKKKKLANVLVADAPSSTKITFEEGSTSNDHAYIISDQQTIEDGTYKNELKQTRSQKYYAALSEKKKEILRKKNRIAYKKRTLCNMTGKEARPSIDTIPEQQVNEVQQIPSRTSNKGKEQIEFYCTYEVG